MELINTPETPGEFDALNKVRPDEPYFTLLGRDRLAPALVQQWADDNRKRAIDEHAAGTIDLERKERELRKSSDAEAIGWAMQAFKAGDLAKRAVGEPTAKAYTGFELPEDAKLRDRLQSARTHASAALRNAMAELAELVEVMEQQPDDPDMVAMVQQSGQLLNHMGMVAEALKPARPALG